MGNRKSSKKNTSKNKTRMKSKSERDKRSKKIDRKIANERENYKNLVKILVLGTGESGKSTFVKQIQIIYKSGFETEFRQMYKTKVQRNIIHYTKQLINSLPSVGLQLKSHERDVAIRFLKDKSQYCDHTTIELKEMIETLWKSKALKRAFSLRSSLQIPDTHSYYLNDLDRLTEEEYLPNDQDILNCRIPTTGVSSVEFEVNNLPWYVVDVGGQRSERRKWIHQFDDVNLVIYVTAISEFDQKLYEDEEVNRMRESLELFDSTINNDYFFHKSCVLLFNKIDLFENKIKETNLSESFIDYEGDNSYDDCLSYLTNLFLKIGNNKKRKVTHLYTCANNTGKIKEAFEVIQQSVLEKVSKDLGKIEKL